MALLGDTMRTLTLCAFLCTALHAQALRVVATTHDLADLAREVAGTRIACEVLSFGDQDPHRVVAKPSTLLKLRKADALLLMGLDLEHSWLPPLLEGARNEALTAGRPGHIDLSVGIEPLEVPAQVDRSRGTDLHARGNPHYNLDPEGGRHMARRIAECLGQLAPDHKADFAAGLRAFEAKLDAKVKDWEPEWRRLKGAKFVTRHGFFPYLSKSAGFDVIADLENTPGLEPSPAHVAKVMQLMREQKPAALLVPSWKAGGLTATVAEGTGIPVLALPMGSTGRGKDATWLDWMSHVISELAAAVPETREH